MKNYIFSSELKRAMNIRVVIAIIGVVFCICFDSWNDLVTCLNTRQGSVHYFFQNSAFGGVCRTYFLPIFSTLPFSTSFCREYTENVLSFIVAREGKKRYCIVKYIINALCGGVVVAIGTALLFAVLSMLLPVTDISYQEVTLAESFHLWLAVYRPVVYSAVEIANGFLIGVLWSCVAIFVSAYIPNSFVVITSPYLVSFAFVHLLRLLKVDNMYRLDKWLSGYSVIDSSVQTLVFSSISVFVIVVILGFIFMKKVGGRIENELRQ